MWLKLRVSYDSNQKIFLSFLTFCRLTLCLWPSVVWPCVVWPFVGESLIAIKLILAFFLIILHSSVQLCYLAVFSLLNISADKIRKSNLWFTDQDVIKSYNLMGQRTTITWRVSVGAYFLLYVLPSTPPPLVAQF